MTQEQQRQYLLWGGIAIVALLGIGLIAFLIGRLSVDSSRTAAPTPLPTVTPTPLPPPIITIQGIKSKADLATVEFNTMAEIYNEKSAEGWLDSLLGTKESLLMLVYGDVQAGFDLDKLSKEDLWVEGKKARLILPAPEILNSSINFERTHIVYYENNLLLDENDPNLQGEALAQSKNAIEGPQSRLRIPSPLRQPARLRYYAVEPLTQ